MYNEIEIDFASMGSVAGARIASEIYDLYLSDIEETETPEDIQ